MRAGAFRLFGNGAHADGHPFGHGLPAVDDRPALFPGHRREEGLAAQVMVISAIAAVSQEDDPPGAVGGLEEVAVPGALDVAFLRGQRAVREDGIIGIRFIRAVDVPAARDSQLVRQFRASFRYEQIIPAVLPVDMRTFRKTSARSAPERFPGGQGGAGLRVDFAQGDGGVGVGYHIAFSILEVERRVDALLLQPDGFAPRACGIGGGDHEVAAAAHVGRDHVEGAVVVPDGRCIDAQRGVGMLQRQLRGPVQDIADLLPVLQVAAVEHGHAGEVVETRIDQVVVSAHRHHGRVGMETGQDGIPQFHFDGRRRSGFLRTACGHSCEEQEDQEDRYDSFHANKDNDYFFSPRTAHRMNGMRLRSS